MKHISWNEIANELKSDIFDTYINMIKETNKENLKKMNVDKLNELCQRLKSKNNKISDSQYEQVEFIDENDKVDLDLDGLHLDRYASYHQVLNEAYQQVSQGKGKERHVTQDENFEDQIICEVNRIIGSNDGCLFQAIKKIYESKKFDDPKKSKHELLGAINYLVAAIILLNEKDHGSN